MCSVNSELLEYTPAVHICEETEVKSVFSFLELEPPDTQLLSLLVYRAT